MVSNAKMAASMSSAVNSSLGGKNLSSLEECVLMHTSLKSTRREKALAMCWWQSVEESCGTVAKVAKGGAAALWEIRQERI